MSNKTTKSNKITKDIKDVIPSNPNFEDKVLHIIIAKNNDVSNLRELTVTTFAEILNILDIKTSSQLKITKCEYLNTLQPENSNSNPSNLEKIELSIYHTEIKLKPSQLKMKKRFTTTNSTSEIKSTNNLPSYLSFTPIHGPAIIASEYIFNLKILEECVSRCIIKVLKTPSISHSLSTPSISSSSDLFKKDRMVKEYNNLRRLINLPNNIKLSDLSSSISPSSSLTSPSSASEKPNIKSDSTPNQITTANQFLNLINSLSAKKEILPTQSGVSQTSTSTTSSSKTTDISDALG